MAALLSLWLVVSAPGATIQGTVRVAGSLEPIPNATISIAGVQRSSSADRRGFFVLVDIPSGTWRIEANAPGYAANAITVVAGESGIVHLDFELEIRPLVLETLDVRVEGLTAERRSAAGPAFAASGPAPSVVQGSSIRDMPGLIEADVLRALQLLPSVSAISDFSTALYVRGGSADQNLITLDGIPLFNPYHVGGIFSAIGVDAVSTVDVWSGAFPAASPGDRLSGIVQINTRRGGRDEFRTSGSIGLLSATAAVDGPIGRSSSFVFSGRRTYLDAVSGAAYGIGLVDNTLPYGFSDAYLKVTRDIGRAGAFSVSGYVDLERVSLPARMRNELRGDIQFGWGARMLAFNYRQPLGSTILLEARAGFSGFSGDFDGATYEGEGALCGEVITPTCGSQASDTIPFVRARTVSRDVVAGGELTWYGRAHSLNVGMQVDAYLFNHSIDELNDTDFDQLSTFQMSQRPITLAAWAEDRWSLTPALHLRFGARFLDAGRLGRTVMPRIGMSWQATQRLSLSLGGGTYAQAVRSLRNDESVMSSFIAYDLVAQPPDSVGLARSRDVVAGMRWTDGRTLVKAEAWARTMNDLVLPTMPSDPMDAPILVNEDYRTGSGSSRGLELSATHHRGIAELSLAYALTHARLRSGEDLFPPRYERRHQLDAAVSLTGRRNFASARLSLGTGQPYTPTVGIFERHLYDPSTGAWSRGFPVFIHGEHNGERLPGYLRLDVAFRRSYERRWFGTDGVITPYLQVLNVLNTRNVLIGDAERFRRPELSYLPQLPFLPTFGLEWRF